MKSYCEPLQQSVPICEGAPTMPGVRRRVYFIAKKYVAQWPAIASRDVEDGTIFVRNAAYTGNFTLATGKKFSYFDVVADKSQLTSESQGEFPNLTQLNKFSGVIASASENVGKLAIALNNVDTVFIVMDNNGNARVIGNPLWPTIAKVSQDLGQGPTGNVATTIEVETTDFVPAPLYKGELVVDTDSGESATIDAGENTIADIDGYIAAYSDDGPESDKPVDPDPVGG